MRPDMTMIINSMTPEDSSIVNQSEVTVYALLSQDYSSSSSMWQREHKKSGRWPLSIAQQVIKDIETESDKYTGIY